MKTWAMVVANNLLPSSKKQIILKTPLPEKKMGRIGKRRNPRKKKTINRKKNTCPSKKGEGRNSAKMPDSAPLVVGNAPFFFNAQGAVFPRQEKTAQVSPSSLRDRKNLQSHRNEENTNTPNFSSGKTREFRLPPPVSSETKKDAPVSSKTKKDESSKAHPPEYFRAMLKGCQEIQAFSSMDVKEPGPRAGSGIPCPDERSSTNVVPGGEGSRFVRSSKRNSSFYGVPALLSPNVVGLAKADDDFPKGGGQEEGEAIRLSPEAHDSPRKEPPIEDSRKERKDKRFSFDSKANFQRWSRKERLQWWPRNGRNSLFQKKENEVVSNAIPPGFRKIIQHPHFKNMNQTKYIKSVDHERVEQLLTLHFKGRSNNQLRTSREKRLDGAVKMLISLLLELDQMF